MPVVDIVVKSKISNHPRVRQLESMFDVPRVEEQSLRWKGDIPVERDDWNVGLIVGPSGAGKTTVARELFGDLVNLGDEVKDDKRSAIECFDEDKSVEEISMICQAVGFNTIPAWMRPFGVLSNGEKFRSSLAMRLIRDDEILVVDEYSSVIDRQVAQIGSHAVQKHIRRKNKKFVAVSCHYDVIEWLQPDWVLEPHNMRFSRRRLRRRPDIKVKIYRSTYDSWEIFAPFHYLTKELNRAAKCYVLSVNGSPAAFAAMLYRPISRVENRNRKPIWGCSRLVTLPDYQGLGLAFVLIDKISSYFSNQNQRTRTYPAHPALVRSFDRSKKWALIKKPGPKTGVSKTVKTGSRSSWDKSSRPCAVFEYVGEKSDDDNLSEMMTGSR